jgi:hypothetical protein
MCDPEKMKTAGASSIATREQAQTTAAITKLKE